MNRCQGGARRLHAVRRDAGRRVRSTDSGFARQVRKLFLQARDPSFRELVVQRGIHWLLRTKCIGLRLRAVHASALRLTFNGTQMVLEPATLSKARFNAAEKAELCSRPENYGRNPDPSG